MLSVQDRVDLKIQDPCCEDSTEAPDWQIRQPEVQVIMHSSKGRPLWISTNTGYRVMTVPHKVALSQSLPCLFGFIKRSKVARAIRSRGREYETKLGAAGRTMLRLQPKTPQLECDYCTDLCATAQRLSIVLTQLLNHGLLMLRGVFFNSILTESLPYQKYGTGNPCWGQESLSTEIQLGLRCARDPFLVISLHYSINMSTSH